MRNIVVRRASMAAVLFAVISSASAMWAQQVRFGARKNKVINGIEAQLRGDFRAATNPIRLKAELENINLPLGTPIAFCLVQNGVKMKIGTGRVAVVAGIQVAEVDLEANDGDAVPNVNVGDLLQARQSSRAPFQANPGCGSPLLISAAFQ